MADDRDFPEFSHYTEWQSLPDGIIVRQVVNQANCLCGADEGAKLLVGAATVHTQESGSIGGFKFVLGAV